VPSRLDGSGQPGSVYKPSNIRRIVFVFPDFVSGNAIPSDTEGVDTVFPDLRVFCDRRRQPSSVTSSRRPGPHARAEPRYGIALGLVRPDIKFQVLKLSV
jgi:hypothetical protein